MLGGSPHEYVYEYVLENSYLAPFYCVQHVYTYVHFNELALLCFWQAFSKDRIISR
jgi:hypothetical protein